jgi:hypothetical protein
MCVAIDGVYTTLVLCIHFIVIYTRKSSFLEESIFEKTMCLNQAKRLSGRDDLIALDYNESFKTHNDTD